MSRPSMILIAVTTVGLAVWGYQRSEGNQYADREVALDSKEAKTVQAMMDQLQQSTNHLAASVIEGASPMVREQLYQRARQIHGARSVTVQAASWSGDYFRVHISSLTEKDEAAEHWFLLAADEAGALKLVGVQH